jgi:hypothetical protein
MYVPGSIDRGAQQRNLAGTINAGQRPSNGYLLGGYGNILSGKGKGFDRNKRVSGTDGDQKVLGKFFLKESKKRLPEEGATRYMRPGESTEY